MIRRICTFCQCELGSTQEADSTDERISHGICASCIEKHFSDCGEKLTDFLDEIPLPVAVINSDRRVQYANKAGQNLLSKNLEQIYGRVGGDVFRCSYAHLPEGCGKTVHCHSYTINQLVSETAETGTAFHRVGAYLDMDGLSGIETVKLLISTERIGSFVFLRIEQIEAVSDKTAPLE